MMDILYEQSAKPSPFKPRKRYPQKTQKYLAELERKKADEELEKLSSNDLAIGDW